MSAPHETVEQLVRASLAKRSAGAAAWSESAVPMALFTVLLDHDAQPEALADRQRRRGRGTAAGPRGAAINVQFVLNALVGIGIADAVRRAIR